MITKTVNLTTTVKYKTTQELSVLELIEYNNRLTNEVGEQLKIGDIVYWTKNEDSILRKSSIEDFITETVSREKGEVVHRTTYYCVIKCYDLGTGEYLHTIRVRPHEVPPEREILVETTKITVVLEDNQEYDKLFILEEQNILKDS